MYEKASLDCSTFGGSLLAISLLWSERKDGVDLFDLVVPLVFLIHSNAATDCVALSERSMVRYCEMNRRHIE